MSNPSIFFQFIISFVAMERLPNELCLEIFRYLTCKDLFVAFDSLNSRFYFLVRSSFIHFEYNNENECLLSVIQPFQIKNIIMSDNYNLQFMINYFQSNQLTQLQRLELTCYEIESLRSIFCSISQLNNLEYLHIYGKNNPTTTELKDLCQNIAEQIFIPSFCPKLKSVRLLIPDITPYYGYLHQPNRLSLLEYFTITCLFLDDLPVIITCLPRIKYIKVIYVTAEDNVTTTKALKQMTENISLRQLYIGIVHDVTITVRDRYLMYIYLSFFSFVQHMKLFLSKLTELRRLEYFDWYSHSFDFDEWTEIFIRSQIDSLCFSIHANRYEQKYFLEQFQSSIWHTQIFNTSNVSERYHPDPCLEARGFHISRIEARKQLDDKLAQESARKKQRAY